LVNYKLFWPTLKLNRLNQLKMTPRTHYPDFWEEVVDLKASLVALQMNQPKNLLQRLRLHLTISLDYLEELVVVIPQTYYQNC
jgi:hypothetical protein